MEDICVPHFSADGCQDEHCQLAHDLKQLQNLDHWVFFNAPDVDMMDFLAYKYQGHCYFTFHYLPGKGPLARLASAELAAQVVAEYHEYYNAMPLAAALDMGVLSMCFCNLGGVPLSHFLIFRGFSYFFFINAFGTKGNPQSPNTRTLKVNFFNCHTTNSFPFFSGCSLHFNHPSHHTFWPGSGNVWLAPITFGLTFGFQHGDFSILYSRDRLVPKWGLCWPTKNRQLQKFTELQKIRLVR